MDQNRLAQKFADGATSGQASNMFIDGDTLYSYGRHFPLTIRLAGGGYLHNGDRYSVTTSGHQSHARSVMAGAQIPFSALQAAGIHKRERFQLRIIEEIPDKHEWICKCPGESHPYSYGCDDGYVKHTLGGALIQSGRKFFIAGIDFETSPANRPQFFLSLLPAGTYTSLADAFAALMPPEVKLARALGANVKRQGDLFFVASTLPTRELPRNGTHAVSVTRYVGMRRIDTTGIPLDRRESHLATEVRKLTGVRFARGTIRHGEHRMLRLGKVWHGVYQNTARASWAAAGNID